MHYIVFDLEFNQDFSLSIDRKLCRSCFEIIQIGAVKLDEHYDSVGSFNRYVRPTIYPAINPFITELTGITTEQLLSEETFPEIYKAFIDFSGGSESVFCVWGMADMKELFRNVEYHKLDQLQLSKMYINLQTHATNHFNLPPKNLLKLKTAVELLSIPEIHPYHNALYDANYTAEIFKKLNSKPIQPSSYDPNYVRIRRPRVSKKVIDFEKLLLQFEKMYSRELTEEEQKMIQLSYKMGKTKQFLK